jgi:RNA polymerase sigma-70 factor, ECF subfamily
LCATLKRHHPNSEELGQNTRYINERHAQFEAVVMPHLADLQRFVQAMTHDVEQTNDLVSETLYLAYKYFDTLREPQAAKSWLFTIARREFYEFLRKNKPLQAFSDNEEELWEDTAPLPDASTDIYLLYQALERLPEKQREAILLFDVFGFSLNDVGELQGDSLSAVKQRLKRGRERLARYLGANTISSDKDYSG